MKEKSIDLGQCIIDCKNDQSCEQSCVSMFKEQYDQCPCQVRRSENLNVFRWLSMIKIFQNDCPFGCPCNSFACQPDKKSVLVLNTFYSSTEPGYTKPVLIKFDGK